MLFAPVITALFCFFCASTAWSETNCEHWVVSSMTDVFLDTDRAVDAAGSIDLAACGNEYEHAQICLRGTERINGVSVTLGPLHGYRGAIPADDVSWRQVGYVHCRPSRYRPAEPGWYPDPLLETPTFNLFPNQTQPIWISIFVAPGTMPGKYSGTATITASGEVLCSVPVALTVWPLELPNPGRLKTSFTFHYGTYGPGEYSDALLRDPGISKRVARFYGGELTPEMKEKYFRFLGQHRIPVDHIYRRRPFDIDDVRLALKHGMQRFCIANVLKIPGMGRLHRRKDGTSYVTQDQVDTAIGYLEPLIGKYREAGLLEYGYIYGFDEVRQSSEPAIRTLYGAIKKRWPDIPTVAVAVGWHPPPDIPIDVLIELYDNYNCDMTWKRTWIDAGKVYGGYWAMGPGKPCMNTFVEWPAMHPRLLLWIAAETEMPFLLYYSVNRWMGERKVIAAGDQGGPKTDFDPATWEDINGDGNLMYPGPDGPLSCRRLENLTDGIEDYELFMQLSERFPNERLWAEKMLHRLVRIAIHPTYRSCRQGIDRTEDPQLLERTRREVAVRLIELMRQECETDEQPTEE